MRDRRAHPRFRWGAHGRLSLHVLPGLLLLVQAAAPASDIAEALRFRTERLREGWSLEIRGVTLRPSDLLPELYERRAFAPLWSDPAHTRGLIAAVEDAAAHGLDPADYALEALRNLPATAPDAGTAADLDLLRSFALARLARDLRRGRVDLASLDPEWRIQPSAAPVDAAAILAIIAGGDIRGRTAELAPSHFSYRGLQLALAALRRAAAAGGWPRVPDGPALAVDSTGARVAALRLLLVRTGDLPAGADTLSEVFDSTLARGVMRFQHRHALNEDGIVGPRTLAELNVPIERRIDLVRINLERARWRLQGLADTFVAVNIAGQRVYLVRNGQVAWETRAIVGRQYTRTPIFVDSMRYIVLNPTWTVPRSINGEILASIRRDPSYLRRQNISVIDASGAPVGRSLDFSQWTGRTFPWVFRQEPGPDNALGRIKFMFPNRFNVYLHDTPARSLFEREDRTFSHGCIRVQDPLHLAELLLDDPMQWSRAALEAALADGATRTVHLVRPVPTLILYWTASTDLHGELHFYRDAYGRDDRLLRALDGAR